MSSAAETAANSINENFGVVFGNDGYGNVRLDPELLMLIRRALSSEHVKPYVTFVMTKLKKCPVNFMLDTAILKLKKEFKNVSEEFVQKFRLKMYKNFLVTGLVIYVVMVTKDGYKFPVVPDHSTYDIWVRSIRVSEDTRFFITRRQSSPADIARAIRSGQLFVNKSKTFGMTGLVTGQAARNQTGGSFQTEQAMFMNEMALRGRQMRADFRWKQRRKKLKEKYGGSKPPTGTLKNSETQAKERSYDSSFIPAIWREEMREPLTRVRGDACLFMDDNLNRVITGLEDVGSEEALIDELSFFSSLGETGACIDNYACIISGFEDEPDSYGALNSVGYTIFLKLERFSRYQALYNSLIAKMENPPAIYDFQQSKGPLGLNATMNGASGSASNAFDATTNYAQELKQLAELEAKRQFDADNQRFISEQFDSMGKHHFERAIEAQDSTGEPLLPGMTLLDDNPVDEFDHYVRRHARTLLTYNIQMGPPGGTFRELRVPNMPFTMTDMERLLEAGIARTLGAPYGLMDDEQRFASQGESAQKRLDEEIASICSMSSAVLTKIFNDLYGGDVVEDLMSEGYNLLIEPEIQRVIEKVSEDTGGGDPDDNDDDPATEEVLEPTDTEVEVLGTKRKSKKKTSENKEPPKKKRKMKEEEEEESDIVIDYNRKLRKFIGKRTRVIDQINKFIKLSKGQQRNLQLFTKEGLGGTPKSRLAWLKNQYGDLRSKSLETLGNIRVVVKPIRTQTLVIDDVGKTHLMGGSTELEMIEDLRSISGRDMESLSDADKAACIERAKRWYRMQVETNEINIEQGKMQLKTSELQNEKTKLDIKDQKAGKVAPAGGGN